MTTNTNLQLIQYKTIHRTHITQSKMFLMGLTDTDNALWGALTPIFMQPGSANLFILSEPQQLRQYPRSWTAESSGTPVPPKYTIPVLVSPAITKKIVFQNWKSNHHWTNLISEFISTEETAGYRKSNISAFKDIWDPFITFPHTFLSPYLLPSLPLFSLSPSTSHYSQTTPNTQHSQP